ncbi:hypothetical protein BH11PSE2_BH11PSE2_20400 [soil metagenome]
MLIVVLILHTIVMGLIALVLIDAGHPIIAVAEYFITLILVVVLVRRPWRLKHGTLYLKHNIFFTRRIAAADIVAIEQVGQPAAKTQRLVRFDIVLRDGSRQLFAQQAIGFSSITKLSAVTAEAPASAKDLAKALGVPMVEADNFSPEVN